MTVLLVANGEIAEVTWLRSLLAKATAVIAIDGGTRFLCQLDHQPDVVIGDMDSLAPAQQAWLQSGASIRLTHPAEKDETDLELALLYAVEHYDGPLQIVGGFGGRLDQTLANVLLLAHPALHGRDVCLLDQHQAAWLVAGRTEINGRVGDTISLIPLGGTVTVLQTDGLQWPLQNEALTFGPARGISNRLTAARAEVVVAPEAAGRLLCIHTRQEWQR